MTTNLPLYRLLVKLGASDADAEQAATVDASALVTKADLQTAIADLKASLLQWGIGLLFTAMAMQTALILFALLHYKP
jgi:hypothetical protein